MRLLSKRKILLCLSAFLLGASLYGCASYSSQNALAANPYANSAFMPITPMPTPAPVPVSQLMHKGTLEITVSEDPSMNAQVAQSKLAYYLPLAPQANRFRVSWHYFAVHFLSEGTALYDRKRGTLNFYSNSGFEDTKSPKRHLLFRGVTDQILIKMAQKDTQKENGAAGGFIHLKNYGCKMTKLK